MGDSHFPLLKVNTLQAMITSQPLTSDPKIDSDMVPILGELYCDCVKNLID